jgi:putative transposase
METVVDLKEKGIIAPLCSALGLSRASFYRYVSPRKMTMDDNKTKKSHPRALSEEERLEVLKTLNSETHMDKAPRQVFASLLDSGKYLCSVSTMYRILRKNKMLTERRNQVRRPKYTKPELLATAPNQLWSWDITKLPGPAKWTYFYLYVILDVFSRFVVGWMVAPRERSDLAQDLIMQSCETQKILPEQLTLHADRGSSMTSKPVAFLLADLGVTKTHSRPHVSNDNPFSESQFKTLKYRPEFPQRFGSIQDARAFCKKFFEWYNWQHYHSSIGHVTPGDFHYGYAAECVKKRAEILKKAYESNPERFPRGLPVPENLPEAVWINPPPKSEKGDGH